MRRAYSFLLFAGLFTGVFQLGSMSDVGPEEAEAFLAEFQELIEGIDAVGIFAHNTAIALPMLLPGFGVAWGLFSAWSTGYAFAALAVAMPGLEAVPPLAVLYLSPFGLMELSAYSLGTSRSCILAALLVKRRPVAPHLRATALEACAMVGLLLAGGFVEFYMIEALAEGGMGLPGLGVDLP